MKILGLFLNNEIRTGGHVRYLELLSGLGGKGHEVTVLMNSALDRVVQHASVRRIPIDYVHGKTRFLGRLFRKEVMKSLRADSLRADWIVIFGETHWLAAKALSRKLGIPVLYALRSDSIEEARSYLKLESPGPIRSVKLRIGITYNLLRERDIARHASLIVFQSAHDRDSFIGRHRSASVATAVIRGDIRQSRFRPDYRHVNASTSCRRLLYVGTLGTRKGLTYLLLALKALPTEERAILSLDILASGKNPEPFYALARETGMDERIRFHGKVTNPLDYMRDADLLITPSLFDSYPNTIIEAVHVGLAVIGSRVGGIPDMLGADELVFEPGSVESLSNRLSSLIRSDEAFARVKKVCEDRREYFDFDWPAEWIKAISSVTKK